MPAPANAPAVPRLTYLRIKNYRALRDVEFRDLTPLSVFIGPNGSGKSTVLDALAFLAEAVSGNLTQAWEKRNRFAGLLPRLLPGDTWRCIPHRGKDALLLRLPALLKTYASRLPHEPALRVVILLDADADCRKAKGQVEKLVAEAGLLTKTTAPAGQPFWGLTRLAVAELEAWFLGDRAAIQAAYPRVHPNHFKGVSRDPDVVPDAWETLHRLLQKEGYYLTSKAKVEWAETIAPHLDPARNTSASFRYFCAGLGALR